MLIQSLEFSFEYVAYWLWSYAVLSTCALVSWSRLPDSPNLESFLLDRPAWGMVYVFVIPASYSVIICWSWLMYSIANLSVLTFEIRLFLFSCGMCRLSRTNALLTAWTRRRSRALRRCTRCGGLSRCGTCLYVERFAFFLEPLPVVTSYIPAPPGGEPNGTYHSSGVVRPDTVIVPIQSSIACVAKPEFGTSPERCPDTEWRVRELYIHDGMEYTLPSPLILTTLCLVSWRLSGLVPLRHSPVGKIKNANALDEELLYLVVSVSFYHLTTGLNNTLLSPVRYQSCSNLRHQLTHK